MNTQIYEEACNWFVDLRAGDVDPAGRRRFDAWIRKSPEHLRAYLEITEIWQDASSVDSEGEGSLAALLERARSESNVVALGGGVNPGAGSRPHANHSVRVRFALAASIGLALLAAGFATWYQLERAPTYATDTGEQRTVTLADGSAIELNSRTRVRVRFTDTERNVELLDGQALFRVAKNHARPFIVRSDTTQVRAVGTQFDVYRKESGTTVTVVEGRVAIASAGGEPQPQPGLLKEVDPIPSLIYLSAGEQVTLRVAEVPQPKKADVAAATGWTEHRLVFKSTPLPEVAQEFNRYNQRQVVIEDQALQTFLVSGVYSSTDPELLLRFLREQPGIGVRETDDEIVVTVLAK
jgi:transmembrane sensor